MKDNGGRRRIADRRRYTSRSHFPERRAIRFRRSGQDRRRKPGMTAAAVGTERRRAMIEAKDEAA